MWPEKFQGIQKFFLYYKYQNMQNCSKIVTPESWHLTYQARRLLLAGIFSTRECGFFWAMVLHSDDRLSLPAQLNAVASILPCLLLFTAYLFVQWNEFDSFRMVWFPKFVKNSDRQSSVTNHGLAFLTERQPRVRSAISTALLDRLADVNRHMIVWIGWVPSIP